MNKTIITRVATVTCIQASRCALTGKKIFTLECEYPRAIHAQLLTHKVFGKNSSSTRAVPLEAAIKQILDNPAKVIWTTNQAGMQGAVVTDQQQLEGADRLMNMAKNNMIQIARSLSSTRSWGQNIHKQNAGRLLEPFQNIKIVLTSTEWENWDWLRIHKDAQGEIADLATAMKEARDTAEIMELQPGEWHVPYVKRDHDADTGEIIYYTDDSAQELTVEQAKLISMSVCAQTSYRKADHSLDKAIKMKGMLVDGHKVHASPFEHQATPIPAFEWNATSEWPEGVTHMRRDYSFGSGNLVGWIQHRQLIKNHDGANIT